ncbi:acyl-CoA dehydrogenase family protein [Nocardioides pantholopis]|uniref:acyl-CoA dehydrogenase family protein n=1 Tax=Nocardioides pantholopis TaxID=2483798 RepID=UPI000F073239|nr:acyl-CoA dehydrogenase family protein [Nocardioides pantholopis]
MLSAEDIDAFEAGVRGHLGRLWPDAGDPQGRDLDALWRVAAEEGWLALEEFDALDAVLRAARACGQVAVPLPLVDAFVARRLVADELLAAAIAEGEVRPVVALGADRVLVEAGSAATHVLLLDDAPRLVPLCEARPQDGVAAPAWSEASLALDEAHPCDPTQAGWARDVVRLGLAARALAAAEAALAMAVHHACHREQFGRPVGTFGAVQQRLATLHIEATAARLLVEEAVRLYQSGDPGWRLGARLAEEHVVLSAPQIQFGAQHTLGAIGYFEESAAPWLFRRVLADLAVLATPVGDSAADRLLAGGSLPALDRTPEAAAFREQVREHFARKGIIGRTRQAHVDDPRAVRSIAAAGFLGLTLPEEHGGQGRGAHDQAVFIEEMGYHRVSAYVSLNAVLFLGKAVADHGTPAQRARFLPMMRDGELRFCLGYSEPETGSDLAALRTRAERDGDEWVVNGQKLWTTRAHRSDWMWLAARTDPDPSLRHRGITIFLLPMDSPGVTVQEHRSQAGEISCSVFLDDVRVSDDLRVGEVGGGWAVINTALAGERTSMAAVTASMHRQLDDLLALARSDERLLGAAGSAARADLSRMATRLQGARVLVRQAVDAIAANGGSRLEAPAAAVCAGELAVDFAVTTQRLLGPTGLLGESAEQPVSHGAFSHHLLMASKSVIGGGTNDILRGLVARGLGLPR